MRESFLHYVWYHQLFIKGKQLYTVDAESVRIVRVGTFTGLEGPDFFNAQIYLGQQLWAGNVEIHLNSSDWYAHQHERDVRYDSVILHVVWENDTPVLRSNGSQIPTIEIRDYVSEEVLANYQKLVLPKQYLFCEDRLLSVGEMTWLQWKERLFFERLEDKINPIYEMLAKTKNH